MSGAATLPAVTTGLTSVVVVAADSGPGLADCIERVLASRTAVEVILVDNASADGAPQAVTQRWVADPRLRVLHNAHNLGFGTGCNRGAAVASGDALLFLNPDCEIEPDTIARLRAAAEPGIGLLGVAIVDADGAPEAASRRRDPTLRRSLMTLSGLAHFESRWAALAGVNVPEAGARPAVEAVDAVSGALMFVARAAFDRVGGFDEGYFLHAEDLDLCRRLRDAGWGVACVNAIRVVHGKGGSSRHRPVFVSWHKHRGLWRWFRKFDPAARHALARTTIWIGLWLHFVLLAPLAALRMRRSA